MSDWIEQRPEDAVDGADEAIGPLATQTIDPHQFREAMSRLGAAVHIVTTSGPAGKAGFTATAVASVSDHPPTLLVCLHHRSAVTPVLRQNGVFCVNTLGAEAEAMADLFAGRTGVFAAERFRTGVWEVLATGAPVLAGAVVALDCRIVEIKRVATHNVVFAAVVAARLGAAGPALVYHERAYKQV